MLPELPLEGHSADDYPCRVQRTLKASDEPQQPLGAVAVTLLRAFQHVIIGRPLLHNLSRHTIKTPSCRLVLRQGHIRKCTRQTPVTILERMHGHEVQMRQRRAKHAVQFREAGLPPMEETRHFRFELFRSRGFVMHLLPTYRPGDHLHGRLTPRTGPHGIEVRIARRKEAGVPRLEATRIERLVAIMRGVAQYLHQAVDLPIRATKPGIRQAQMFRDGRTHALTVELFALDGCRVHGVLFHNLRPRLKAIFETEARHSLKEAPLLLAGSGQRNKKLCRVPAEMRPLCALPEILGHGTSSLCPATDCLEGSRS